LVYREFAEPIANEEFISRLENRPNWPLQLHARISKIGKQLRDCLTDCASGDPTLIGLCLDVDRVTQILKAAAVESFSVRLEYLASLPDSHRPGIGNVIEETVDDLLRWAPFVVLRSSRFVEAVPEIWKALRQELLRTYESTVNEGTESISAVSEANEVENSNASVAELTGSQEDRLVRFIKEHPGTTLADIKYSARVHTTEFQDWRIGRLKSSSVMAQRIEKVLGGSIPLNKKPRKTRGD
jgi:hypothetical protein